MPKYTSNAALLKGGKVYKYGEDIELTEEQAERLGEKVTAKEVVETFVPGAQYEEADFRSLPADEQKKVVEQYGGDLNEYTNADKRWAFVSTAQ